MTISDMDTVIALGGYQTAAASSVGKIQRRLTVTDRHLSITTLQEQVPSDSRQRLRSHVHGMMRLQWNSEKASVKWQMKWGYPDGMPGNEYSPFCICRP